MNRVRDIMNTDLVTVSPDTTVHELTRVLSEHGISGAPVVDMNGEVLGGLHDRRHPSRRRRIGYTRRGSPRRR